MRKKRIAWVLLIVMLVNMLPLEIIANTQNPSKKIDHITVSNNKTSTGLLPNVTVQWKGINNTLTSVGDQGTQFYKFIMTDATGSGKIESNNIPTKGGVDQESQEYVEKIEDYVDSNLFTNGKLFKIEVAPGHRHESTVPGGDPIYHWGTGNEATGFFITDFDTKLTNKNGNLEVSFEHIPGASYEVVYLEGDKTTVEGVNEGITASNGATIEPIRKKLDKTFGDDTNNQYVDEKGVKRVKFNIPQPTAGQIYSVYVVPTGVNNSFTNNYDFNKIAINTETGVKGPQVAQAATSIPLKVYDVEPNNVRLEWNLGAWITENQKLIKTTIYKMTDENMTEVPIGTILNESLGQNKDLGYYQYTRPKEKTYFIVKFQIDGLEKPLETEVFTYIPGEAAVQPLKPQVPRPYSPSLDMTGENVSDYKVSGDNIALDNPEFINNTFHVISKNPSKLQIVWDAPTKKDEDNNTVVDYDLVYDLYVTKDKDQLDKEGLLKVGDNLPFYEDRKENLIETQTQQTGSASKVVGFKAVFNEYVNGQNEKVKLTANSTYFIKVVAKRPFGKDYILSEPTVVSITIGEDGEIFTPPVLAKPPLKLKDTTSTTATLRWRTTWQEIYVKNAELRQKYSTEEINEEEQAKSWNSTVYLDMAKEPFIRFKKPNETSEEVVLENENALDRVKKAVNTTSSSYYLDNYVDREVTLGTSSKYELKVLSYDEMNEQIAEYNKTSSKKMTLQDWIVKTESSTTEGWDNITPWVPTEDKENDNSNWLEYRKEGLTPNTRYVVLIRAYKVLDDGTKLIQTYPSYVLATTLSDQEPEETVPKVPVLNLETKSDSSITVYWQYNKNFDYEIVYSRLDDPKTATKWDFKLSDTPGDENYVTDGARATVTITGLLPDTTYNIWIKAKQKKGSLESSFSNPVTATTNPLGTPDVPTGLGAAAYETILELGQDFKPVDKNHITVEWVRVSGDKESEVEENKNAEKKYSYIVELSESSDFLDPITVETTDEGGTTVGGEAEILAKNVVKFKGLIANRPYYVRVKAILTFEDKEGKRVIKNESAFTKWVRILTKKSDEEYDGGDSDGTVTYPNPIEQDYKNNIWTWEIVDTANIISKILKQKQYYYTVDVQKYDNKYDALIRRVRIPKAVIDTLINQSMALKIVTSTGIYEIPASTISYAIKDYDAKDIVQFELAKAQEYKMLSFARPYTERLLKGESLAITVKGKSKNSEIKNLDGQIEVKIKLDIAQQYQYTSLFTYLYNYNKGAWEKQDQKVDAAVAETYITFKTSYTGLYTLYENVITGASSSSTYTMSKLASTYNVLGLGSIYFKKDPVYRDQYINLLLGIAEKKDQIDLVAAASSKEIQKAKASGLYTASHAGVINEEEALAGIIKLYELKNGYKVKPSSVKFNNVSPAYREAIQKAYALGLIESINPKQTVTFDKLADWLWQILE